MKKFKSDKLREECGVFGISNHEDVYVMVALGLHVFNTEVKEVCGIVLMMEAVIILKRQGLVEIILQIQVLKKLPGSLLLDTVDILQQEKLL